MAGLGAKTFAAGEVLTASDVNGYLMQQAVAVFATTGARTTAIPSPSAGMASYITGTNSFEIYTGSAWVAVSGAGAWTTYAPTLTPTTNSFSAISYSTQDGAYRVNGKTVHFRANLVVNSITIGTGSGNIRILLPFTSATSSGQMVACKFLDNSTGNQYRTLFTIPANSLHATAGQYGDGITTQITTAVPSALSSGDQFILTGTYEIA